MLALSNVYPLQPCTEIASYATVRETHIRGFLPSAHSLPSILENTSLNPNFQELIETPAAFCSCLAANPRHLEVSSQGIIARYCANRSAQCPHIQRQNAFVNNSTLKSVTYTSHNFRPQERDLSYVKNTFQTSRNPVLQDCRNPFAMFGNCVYRNNDNTSFQDRKSAHGNTANMKTSSKFQVCFRRSYNPVQMQNYSSCSPLDTNVKIQMMVAEQSRKRVEMIDNIANKLDTKHRSADNIYSDLDTKHIDSDNIHGELDTRHREVGIIHSDLDTRHRDTGNIHSELDTRHRDNQYSPPARKKLRHSIASILNITPGYSDCNVSENSCANKAKDNFNCIENNSDEDSINVSDIFVDDDEDDFVSSRSENGEGEIEIFARDSCVSHKQDVPSYRENSSKNEDKSSDSETPGAEMKRRSVLDTDWGSSPHENVDEHPQNERIQNLEFFEIIDDRDSFHQEDLYPSHLDIFTLVPREREAKIIHNTNGTLEANNASNKLVNKVFSSQSGSKNVPLLSKEDLIPSKNIPTARPQLALMNPTSSTVLPPIQTLCQPYKKAEADERSAFKPITKLSPSPEHLPDFLIPYRNWASSNILLQNFDPPNINKHENVATARNSSLVVYPPRQSQNNLAAKASSLDAIGVLRQKSSFYQNQGISEKSIPPAAPLATELLPNTLERWITWLRHREASSIKPATFDDRTPSRVPPPPRYHCDACSKTYSTFGGLSKHRQFHCSQHVRKEFACKVCNRAYSSLGALKMHIRTHTLPCKCHECGKAFSRPWLLQGHLRTHTGEKPFKCSHCGRAFADRSNLRAHLQTHAEVKRYACNKCGKTFSRMSLLTKHTEGSCPVNIREK